MGTSTTLAPVQIGDLLIQPDDLIQIVQSYVRTESVLEVAKLLELDPEDVAIIVGDPGVVSKAIEAKRQLLRLMLYGPLADAMVTAVTVGSDMRTKVMAFKALKDLVDSPTDGSSNSDNNGPQGNNQAPTVNLAFLINGGFDTAVRQLEGITGQQAEELADVIDAEYHVTPEKS